VVIFVILPSWGLSNAAATLVGQNLGAGKPERAEQAVWRTGFYNMLFLGSLGVFFIFMAEPIARLFTRDPAVIPLAASCLRIISYGNIGYAYGMVMLQAFNGAGDTVTPTIVNFFGFWLLEIPLAYWLAIPMGLHSKGAYIAIVIAECSIAAASAVLFKRGKWKTQKI
jgi:Na+-driven multidrug efflux pump